MDNRRLRIVHETDIDAGGVVVPAICAGDPATADLIKDAIARERREAYVRGHQLAEMRKAAGLTQAELADALGVSQTRISKIEHGQVSGIDIVRAYVTALGGTVDMVATVGDRTWRVA